MFPVCSLAATELLCHVAEPDTACPAMTRLKGRPVCGATPAQASPPALVLLPRMGAQHVATLWTFRKQVSNR